MKLPQTMVLIVILSLAIWTFFFLFGVPLTTAESVVVVGFSALVLWLLRSLAERLRRRKADENRS